MIRFSASVLLLAVLIAEISGCATRNLPSQTASRLSLAGPLSTLPSGLQEATSFDVYTENNVVHVLAGGKTAAGDKQGALRYLFSQDGGRSWSKPVALGGQLPKFINIRGNDVQLAANGPHLLALWQTKGELPGMGPLVTAYSDDGGLTWRQGGNPAVNNQGDQSHADLIADNEGIFHAVWLEDPEENGYQSLRYARSENGGKAWENAVALDESTCSCCWNTFSLSKDSTLNILYRDMKPRDMAMMQSQDGGRSWRRAGLVGEFGWQFDGCPHTGGALVSSGGISTHLHSLVWTGLESKPGLYYLSSGDSGRSWSIPEKMGETAIHGDLAALNNDRIAAVWDEMGANGSSIVFTQSGPAGKNWQPPSRLSGGDVNATHPRLVHISEGYVVFWTEKAAGRPAQLMFKAGS